MNKRLSTLPPTDMPNLITKLALTATFSISAMAAHAQCETEIRNFYTAYMRNAEHDETANGKLLKAHMSPELIAKLKAYTLQHDADAVIHAQDVCNYAINSLTVVPTEKDWYMVKYRWDAQSDYINIPVKAINTNGKLIILDISPVSACTDDESQTNDLQPTETTK